MGRPAVLARVDGPERRARDRRGDPAAHGGSPHGRAPVVGMVNTVQVDDLDAALAKAFDRGGVLALDKMVIPGVGTVAYVLDSEANVVGILQPEAYGRGQS